jgi:putative hydrolase of the HAD superfamily
VTVPITTVAFDGDDTLWHNETVFSMTQQRIAALLATHVDTEALDRRLYETETRNLRLYGYGAKSFILSMIETAIEVTDGGIDTATIREVLAFGKAMLEHPVELLEGVRECLEGLAATGRYQLLVITKGELFHQESKFARSGLEDLMAVEIVNEKDVATYRRILRSRAVEPEEFCMVGNSLRSDILPVLELGATAVHVPYPLTWAHEIVDPQLLAHHTWHEVGSLAAVPDLLASLERAASGRDRDGQPVDHARGGQTGEHRGGDEELA